MVQIWNSKEGRLVLAALRPINLDSRNNSFPGLWTWRPLFPKFIPEREPKVFTAYNPIKPGFLFKENNLPVGGFPCCGFYNFLDNLASVRILLGRRTRIQKDLYTMRWPIIYNPLGFCDTERNIYPTSKILCRPGDLGRANGEFQINGNHKGADLFSRHEPSDNTRDGLYARRRLKPYADRYFHVRKCNCILPEFLGDGHLPPVVWPVGAETQSRSVCDRRRYLYSCTGQ